MNEIFRLFFRMGLTGFGGPVALIAMMEEQVVRERGWLTPAEFSEAYSICKLLPGPVAVQMAIHLGARRGGCRGGLVAGLAFTLPALGMILALSVFYLRAGALGGGRLARAFTSTQAAAIALVLLSTWGLAKPYIRQPRSVAILLASFAWLYRFPTTEPLVIFAAGAFGAWLATRRPRRRPSPMLRSLGFPALLLIPATPGHAELMARIPELFWVCFKAGEFVFGTGLAILPLLEGELVGKLHWLTHAEFIDGIALGQVTPGPITISVVFFGIKAAGFLGAGVAFAGIYLPAFFNVLVVLPRIWKKVSGTPAMAGFAAWAFPAVIGGIASATLKLGVASLSTAHSLLILSGSLAAVLGLRAPSWALIPIAGVVGYLV